MSEQKKEEIQTLIEECERLTVAGEKGALQKLRALEKIARELEDYALLGFVYFYAANWYYDTSQYEKFQSNLRQAIHALLHSDSYALLARCYNFFAIDALISGVHDVAYSYYRNALRFSERTGDDAVRGVVLHNLANFYSEIGDGESARKYYRQSIRLMDQNKEDPFYFRNAFVAHINDGENSLSMNDLASAWRSFERLQRLQQEHPDSLLPDVVLSLRFFVAHLHLAENDTEKADEQIGKILQSVNEESVSLIEIEDVQRFCFALMEHDRMEVVTKLLSLFRPYIERADFAHSERVLVKIECAYYDRLGDEKKLIDALRRQHHLLMQQTRERAKIYKYSMDLIKLVDELQEEENKVRRENEHLQVEILTDHLTGIANRYAFDQEISAAFERAYQGAYALGVAILDVDDFKQYNDRYGHTTGDDCLQQIGGILKKIAREEKIFCARYGGDEFVVLFEGRNSQQIRKIASRIRAAIREITVGSRNGDKRSALSVSQGICNDLPRAYAKPWDFLSEADDALYEAKEEKAGTIVLRALSEFG